MSDLRQDKPETIKMVEQAMNVLNYLCSQNKAMGVNTIAKLCKLNPSTCYRILKSLEKTGWIYQLSDDRYIPGHNISFVTEKSNFYLALCDVAKFVMDDYTSRFGIAMNLMVRNGASCTIIQQALTNNIVNYVPPIHTVLPYYACGGGKILLCELPDLLIEQILVSEKMVALTPYTITDTSEYRKALRATVENGYAIDFQESSMNGSCVAVPVRDREGTIIASLSFSGFIGIADPNSLLQYVPALKEASQKITDTLYQTWLAE